MAITKMTIHKNDKLTSEQIAEIEEAKNTPITFDDDCPELTDEQYARFAVEAKRQRADRQKQLISLRVSSETLKKAKMLGRGYSGVLSRILDIAINDAELVKKCL